MIISLSSEKLVAKVNTEIEALVERGDVESRDSLRRYGRRKPIRVLCAYQNHIDLYDASLDDGISVRELFFHVEYDWILALL